MPWGPVRGCVVVAGVGTLVWAPVGPFFRSVPPPLAAGAFGGWGGFCKRKNGQATPWHFTGVMHGKKVPTHSEEVKAQCRHRLGTRHTSLCRLTAASCNILPVFECVKGPESPPVAPPCANKKRMPCEGIDATGDTFADLCGWEKGKPGTAHLQRCNTFQITLQCWKGCLAHVAARWRGSSIFGENGKWAPFPLSMECRCHACPEFPLLGQKAPAKEPRNLKTKCGRTNLPLVFSAPNIW